MDDSEMKRERDGGRVITLKNLYQMEEIYLPLLHILCSEAQGAQILLSKLQQVCEIVVIPLFAAVDYICII